MLKNVPLIHYPSTPLPNSTIPYESIGVYQTAAYTVFYVPVHVLTGNYLATSVQQIQFSTSSMLGNTFYQMGCITDALYVETDNNVNPLTAPLPTAPSLLLIRNGSRYDLYNTQYDSPTGTPQRWRFLVQSFPVAEPAIQEERLTPVCLEDVGVKVLELHLDHADMTHFGELATMGGEADKLYIREFSVFITHTHLYIPMIVDATAPPTYGKVSLADVNLPPIFARYFISNSAAENVYPRSSMGEYLGIYLFELSGTPHVILYYGANYVTHTPAIKVTDIGSVNYYDTIQGEAITWTDVSTSTLTVTEGNITLKTTGDETLPGSVVTHITPTAVRSGVGMIDLSFSMAVTGLLDTSALLAVSFTPDNPPTDHPNYPKLVNDPITTLSVRFHLDSTTLVIAMRTDGGAEVIPTLTNTTPITAFSGTWRIRLYGTMSGTEVLIYEGDVLRARATTSIPGYRFRRGGIQWYLRNVASVSSVALTNITIPNYPSIYGLGSLCRAIDAVSAPSPCDNTTLFLSKVPYTNYLSLEGMNAENITNNTILPSQTGNNQTSLWTSVDDNINADKTLTLFAPGMVDGSDYYLRSDEDCYAKFQGVSSGMFSCISLHTYLRCTDMDMATPIVMEIQPSPQTGGALLLDRTYRLSIITASSGGWSVLSEAFAHPQDPNQGTVVEILNFGNSNTPSNVIVGVGLAVNGTKITLYINSVAHTVTPTPTILTFCKRLGRVAAPYLTDLQMKLGGGGGSSQVMTDSTVVYVSDTLWPEATFIAANNYPSTRTTLVDCSAYALITSLAPVPVFTPIAPQRYGGVIKATGVGNLVVSESTKAFLYSVDTHYAFAIVDLVLTALTEDTEVKLAFGNDIQDTYQTVRVPMQGVILRGLRVQRGERLHLHTDTNSGVVVRMSHLLG